MAGAAPTTSTEGLFSGGRRKQVQELVENGDEVPPGFVWKDRNGYGPIDLAVPLAKEIPIVDFSRLISSSSPPSSMDAELLKLRSALASWGCFQAINHGIDVLLLNNLRELSRKFFHLPMTEKQKCGRVDNGYEGYGNDPILVENQSLDWSHRLYLIVNPQSQRKLEYWPDSLRNMLNEYTDHVKMILKELLKALTRSLSLPDDRFVEQIGEEPTIFARFNFYPTCARPDLVLGLKPHSDGSVLTFLLQDREVHGLQLLKDDQWFQVPIMPHALLVNVGDQLEIMSNGEFKSPVHKVITNSKRERNTLAMFCLPNPTMEVGPVEELVDGTRPRLFKKVKDYVGTTYFHYVQRGERPLDTARI